MSQTDVYIMAAARTPIGSFNGTLSNVKASDIGCVVVKELLQRSRIKPEQVDEVILGQTLTAGQGQNPARQAAIKAGLPNTIPAFNINMLCGSGLKAVVLAHQAIRSGVAGIVIAGGQENMSMAPHTMHLRKGVKIGSSTMLDSILHDGITDAFHNVHMGLLAENLAGKYNISREAQDNFAFESQQKASLAHKNDHFVEELVTVDVNTHKGTTHFECDEYIKHNVTVEDFKLLKPAFKVDGTITAGNASGINDAAAAVLLMGAEEMQQQAIKPLACIVAWAQAGCEPAFMGIGAAYAVEAVLRKAGWSKDDVDLYELNEAFAAQALSVNQVLGLSRHNINIQGGAIALGHPIGASGARILVTLLYALKRTGKHRGVASLCIGGGMGIAIAVERFKC